jgi:hypothetical protein
MLMDFRQPHFLISYPWATAAVDPLLPVASVGLAASDKWFAPPRWQNQQTDCSED